MSRITRRTVVPVNQITPLTYRDGVTYIQMLTQLSDYIKSILHPSLQHTVDQIVADVEAQMDTHHDQYVDGVQEFQRIHDAFMSDVNAHLIALNDTAMSDLFDDETSLVRRTMSRYFENRRTIDPRNYPTIYDAVDDVQDGDIFMLDRDYTINRALNFNATNIVVDGKGHTLTFQGDSGDSMIVLNGEHSTLKNITLDGGGQCFYAVRVMADHATVRHVSGGWSRYTFIGVTDSSHHVIQHVRSTEAGWDAVGFYGKCEHTTVSDCVSLRSGRHGFSTDGGSDTDSRDARNITFTRCLAIDTGDPSLNEGKSSFHFERTHSGKLIDCEAHYTRRHPNVTTYHGGGPIPGVRVEYSPDTLIDGFRLTIDQGYSPRNTTGNNSWLYQQQSDRETTVFVRGAVIRNNSNIVSTGYLGQGTMVIRDSTISGAVTLTQRAVATDGVHLDGCTLNGHGHPYFLIAQWGLRVNARNNTVRNYDHLITGHLEHSTIQDNEFNNSGDVQFGLYGGDGRFPKHNLIRRNWYHDTPVCHTVESTTRWNSQQAVFEDNTYSGDIGTVLRGVSGGGVVEWRNATVDNANIDTPSTATTTLDSVLLSDDDHRVNAKGLNIFGGTQHPEGNITSPLGSLYLRTTGGAGATVFVKEGGGTGSTGWAAK